ncbi:MAG: metallophosphatase family protein [Eggerthellaceae bacterium]|nr:metallophosphatase family protein [Eggerthellaceae bacterium]
MEESPQSQQSVLVGVISDTHGRLPHAAFAALAECDYIIHAGDIGGPSILRSLESLATVYAVLGNNDYNEYGEKVGRFARPVILGVRFLVAHYPQDVSIGWKTSPGLGPGDPVPQVCVHGHTHVSKIVTGKDASPAQYIICPGSVFRPRAGSRPSVAKLQLVSGRVGKAWIEEI